MTVKETLEKCLLTYPLIFKNAFDVYEHLFIVAGTGYEWKDGQLSKYGGEKYCSNIEESIIKQIENTFIKGEKNIIESLPYMNKYISWTTSNLIEERIKPLFHIEEYMNDFSIKEEKINGLSLRNKIYPINNLSNIYLIPENIKNDWLKAAKKMIDILENNKDKFHEYWDYDVYEETKRKINAVYDYRYNHIEYLGKIYKITGKDTYKITGKDTKEVGAGCHSFDVDVYICESIDNNHKTTFEHVEDKRLINLNDYE